MKAGTVALLAVGGLVLAAGGRLGVGAVNNGNLKLRYWTPAEFGAYWPLMNPRLLLLLDNFRHALGYPVDISPAAGAIGRPLIGVKETNTEGEEKSFHNYAIHGSIMAVDLMPRAPGGGTPAERQRWYDVARQVGFTGIGIYPHWRPRPGIHVDIGQRPGRPSGYVATWAGLRGADGVQRTGYSIAEGIRA